MRPTAFPSPAAGNETFLFASESATHVPWMSNALQRRGTVIPVAPVAREIDRRIAASAPQAVFLDFSGAQVSATVEVHEHLRRAWPALPIIGVGSSADSKTLLTALRAGVDDFLDVSASASDLHGMLDDLLRRRGTAQAGTRGRHVALLGARAGLGVTTLATHLALLLQDHLAGEAAAVSSTELRHCVALLDLGLPARDGLLYLDTPSDFSLVDAMQNLHRLDETLVQTALSRHASGAAVLSLPADPAQMREIGQADPVALIQRMADFFKYQIADLGGSASIEFTARAVKDADKTWVVCDQSIGAMVSTAALLRDLQARGQDVRRFSLVVNMFDPAAGIAARDIAERLQLPLAHVLPTRRAPLLAAAGRGQMLANTSRGDPYVTAVQALLRGLQTEYGPAAGRQPGGSPWTAWIAPLTHRRKTARER